MIERFLKGVCIGGTMTIPGASGGTMAMVLNIYDDLVRAISRFADDIKGNLILLAQVAAGGAVGLLLLSRLMLWLLESFKLPVMFFFMGAVCGGLPMLFKKTKKSAPGLYDVLCMAIGLCAVLSLRLLPRQSAADAGFLLMFAAGLVLAVALILPGISVSHVLLLFGLYDKTLEAIAAMDVMFLLPIALGVGVGVVASARLLETAMAKAPTQTYFIIAGFVMGAIIDIFPGFPQGWQWIICIATFAAGAAAILLVSREKRE